jgi:uncharacterized protein
MLIEFTVGNFRSFKEPASLSMVATKIRARDPAVNKNNTIIVDDKLTLLTSAAVYGANASGKSNLIRALVFMQQFVLTSANESQSGELIGVENFQLSTETDTKPSFFEVVFLLEGIQYRYGFEVNRKEIVSEWLFSLPSTKEAMLFVREQKVIKRGTKFKEGKNLEDKTRSNALFLSVVAQFNGQIAQTILKWFQRIGIVSGLNDIGYRVFTINQVIEGKYKSEIVKLVKSLDVGLDEVVGIKLDKAKFTLPPDMPEEIRTIMLKSMEEGNLLTVQTKHTKFNAKGQPVDSISFDMDQKESHGTQKLFYLAGPIVDVLSQGKILVVDEMEARLHPLITQKLIQLFNSKKTNSKHAQLIFTTHDTNLLSNKFFRRDQIWFIEKDTMGCSYLYSLAELKVRNDRSFDDDYISGRYGAIPFIGGVQTIELKSD